MTILCALLDDVRDLFDDISENTDDELTDVSMYA